MRGFARLSDAEATRIRERKRVLTGSIDHLSAWLIADPAPANAHPDELAELRAQVERRIEQMRTELRDLKGHGRPKDRGHDSLLTPTGAADELARKLEARSAGASSNAGHASALSNGV